MDLFKIVFTGGPCAGKTTQINLIKYYLEKKGYKVITVSETATDIINSGLPFNYINSLMDFQTLMLKVQYFKEKIYEENLKNKNQKIIILYDRGILDNKAYFDNYRDFDYMMKVNDKSEIDILDSYDMVIDLISLAKCAPDKYNLESNIARSESIEVASLLDEKTSNAWAGHQNLYLFNSNVSIEEEFKLIAEKIDAYINHKNYSDVKKIEIDNKLSDFNNYNDNNSRLINIEKIILNNNLEIYRRTYKANISYILESLKDEKTYSKKISFNEYIELINKYDIEYVEKYLSLNFVRNMQLYEIKFYEDKTILEYEENKLNDKVEFPSEIKFCKGKENVLI